MTTEFFFGPVKILPVSKKKFSSEIFSPTMIPAVDVVFEEEEELIRIEVDSWENLIYLNEDLLRRMIVAKEKILNNIEQSVYGLRKILYFNSEYYQLNIKPYGPLGEFNFSKFYLTVGGLMDDSSVLTPEKKQDIIGIIWSWREIEIQTRDLIKKINQEINRRKLYRELAH